MADRTESSAADPAPATASTARLDATSAALVVAAPVTVPPAPAPAPTPTPTPAPTTAPGPSAAVDDGDRIAVDEHNDNDSALGDDASDFSSTASIGSSILNYRQLHGRTYHNFQNVDYWGPNDDKQNNGLDLNHHMLIMAHDNKLFYAPLDKPAKIIDVGTGTGVWAVDFADQYPATEVIGTDLSPIQPTWVPPNCKFELDDASMEWTFPDNTFDYIHLRYMLGSIKDWPKLYKECLRCLKPGGWLEHMDVSVHMRSDDGSVPADSVWSEWAKLFIQAGEKTGQTFEIIDNDNFVNWMKEAGFGHIHTHTSKLPMGGWPADRKWKEIGQFNRLSCEEAMEGYVLYLFTNLLGWKYEEVQMWLIRVRQAIKNRGYHGYYECASAWTQKPSE